MDHHHQCFFKEISTDRARSLPTAGMKRSSGTSTRTACAFLSVCLCGGGEGSCSGSVSRTRRSETLKVGAKAVGEGLRRGVGHRDVDSPLGVDRNDEAYLGAGTRLECGGQWTMSATATAARHRLAGPGRAPPHPQRRPRRRCLPPPLRRPAVAWCGHCFRRRRACTGAPDDGQRRHHGAGVRDPCACARRCARRRPPRVARAATTTSARCLFSNSSTLLPALPLSFRYRASWTTTYYR